MQPGLSRSESEAFLKDAGIPAPPELVDLHEWRNGTACEAGTILSHAWFFPGFRFIPLKEALAARNVGESVGRWQARYFPIFDNGGGDYYLLDCSVGNKTSGRVLEDLTGFSEEPAPAYESLALMLATLEEAYRTGAIGVTPEGRLRFDDRAYAEIAGKKNPSIEIWRT
jgi:hypothetical protein